MPTQAQLNYLQSNRSVLTIHALGDLNFTVVNFPLPGMRLGPTVHPTPYRNMPIMGDKIDYEELSIEFLVEENFSNYIEVHNWIRNLGAPEDKSTEYATRTLTYSDASAIIYTSHNNPVVTIKYLNLVPTSLSAIDITTQDSETVYKTATVTFEYERFDIVSE